MSKKRGKYGQGRVYQPTYKVNGTIKTVSKWYIQFYDKNGNQIREPAKHQTGEYARSEKDAREILTQRMAEAANGTAPIIGSKNLRYGDLRERLLRHYDANKMKSLEILSSTGERSLKGLTKLDEFMGFRKTGSDDKGIKVEDIHDGMWLSGFVEPRRKEGISDATIRNSGVLLRQMFKLASTGNPRLLNPAQVPTITLPKPPKPRKDFATKEEFDKLLTALDSRFHAYATFLFYQAVRKVEAADITWSQINLADAMYYPDAEKNKTGDDTPRPLADEAVAALRELKQSGPDDRVFPHSAKAFHKVFEAACYQTGLCRKAWRCEQCGCIKDAPDGNTAIICPDCLKRSRGSLQIPMQYHKVGLTVHGLRRSAVVYYREARFADSEIMAVTGHKSNKTFLGYSQTRIEQMRKRLHSAGAERERNLSRQQQRRLTA